MVTTKQKLIVNTRKIKKKEYKHATKQSHQTTKEENKMMKGIKMNYKNNWKTTKWQ